MAAPSCSAARAAVAALAGEPRQGTIGVWATLTGVVESVAPAATPALTVSEVDQRSANWPPSSGPGRGNFGPGSSALFGRATAEEAFFLRRLFTGELRHGALADAEAGLAPIGLQPLRPAAAHAGGHCGERGRGRERRPVVVEWKLDGSPDLTECAVPRPRPVSTWVPKREEGNLRTLHDPQTKPFGSASAVRPPAAGEAVPDRASSKSGACRCSGPRRSRQVDLLSPVGRADRPARDRAGREVLATGPPSDPARAVGGATARSRCATDMDHGRRPRAQRCPRGPARRCRHGHCPRLLTVAVRLAGPPTVARTYRLLALALEVAKGQLAPAPRCGHEPSTPGRASCVPKPTRAGPLRGSGRRPTPAT